MQEFSLSTTCPTGSDDTLRLVVRRLRIQDTSYSWGEHWRVVSERLFHGVRVSGSSFTYHEYENARRFAITRLLMELDMDWDCHQPLPELEDLRILCTVQIEDPPCPT